MSAFPAIRRVLAGVGWLAPLVGVAVTIDFRLHRGGDIAGGRRFVVEGQILRCAAFAILFACLALDEH